MGCLRRKTREKEVRAKRCEELINEAARQQRQRFTREEHEEFEICRREWKAMDRETTHLK